MGPAIAGQNANFVVATEAMSVATEPRNTKSRSKAQKHLGEVIEFELHSSRYQHLTWALICTFLGIFMIWALGIIAKVVGVAIIMAGIVRTYKLTRTLFRPPGTFRLDKTTLTMPLGLCTGEVRTVEVSEIRHAFVLRRASHWARGSSQLVIEIEEEAHIFPREWFETDTQPYYLADAIRLRLPRGRRIRYNPFNIPSVICFSHLLRYSLRSFIPGAPMKPVTRLSLLCVFMLAACGPKNATTPGPQTPVNSKPNTAPLRPLGTANAPALVAPTPQEAPDTLFGMAVIGDLVAQTKSLAAFADNVQPGVGSFLKPDVIVSGIANILELPTLPGLDISKPIYVLMLDPKVSTNRNSPYLIAGDTTDAKALSEALASAESLAMRQFGTRVVIGPESVLNVAGDFALTKLRDLPIPAQPTATLYVSQYTARYADEILAAKQQMSTMISASASTNIEFMKTAFDGVFALVDQTDKTVFSLETAAQSASLVTQIQAKPNTTASTFIAKQKPSTFSIFGHVPKSDIVLAGDLDTTAISDFARMVTLQMFRAEDSGAMAKAITQWMQSVGTTLAMSSSLADGMSGVMIFGIRNGKGALTAARNTLKAAAKSKLPVGRYSNLRMPKFRHKRIPVDEYTFKANLQTLPVDQQETFKRLYGNKGIIKGHQTVVNDYYITTLGKNSRTLIKTAITQFTTTANAPYSDVWRPLVADAKMRRESLLGHINIATLLRLIANQQHTDAPVVFGVGFSPQAMSIRTTMTAAAMRTLRN